MDAQTVSSASITPEYCLLWFDHWTTCMTKSEWSGWIQAFGALAALAVAWTVLIRQSAQAERLHSLQLEQADFYEQTRVLVPAADRLQSTQRIFEYLHEIADRAQIATTLDDVAFFFYRQVQLQSDRLTLTRLMNVLEALDIDPHVDADTVILLTSASPRLWAVRECLDLLHAVDLSELKESPPSPRLEPFGRLPEAVLLIEWTASELGARAQKIINAVAAIPRRRNP